MKETMDTCCGADKKDRAKTPRRVAKAPPKEVVHPNHSAQLSRLNRVVGQLNGVKRMIEERRYCPEILTQMRAAAAALKSAELLILGTHLRHCVAEAVQARDSKEAEKKVEELVTLLEQQ